MSKPTPFWHFWNPNSGLIGGAMFVLATIPITISARILGGPEAVAVVIVASLIYAYAAAAWALIQMRAERLGK